jgi:DNA-binding response OmpR family regulator
MSVQMPTVLSIDTGAHQSRELVLAKNGYQVVPAHDLHHALEFFRSSTVDVVVLDAGSCVSTISPFARQLKTAKPQVPVLLITDNAADADNEAEPACFDAVMSRLEGPVVLLERLSMLLATANTSRKIASDTRSNSSELRARMRQLRQQITRARELSREILNKHRAG